MNRELNNNTMDFLITNKVKQLWDEWNIRIAVLVSLLLQILLIFIATWRKRTGRRLISLMIWGAYLLADWVAAFAVGLIFSAQGSDSVSDKLHINEGLAAFWAPFLLLHLGGPDTITAFALEDNELWLRHFLGLVVQVAAVAYVFLKSVPNEFWIPTVLMFFAGTIKYGERTRALYLACLRNFKASMLPKPEAGTNYAQLMEEYSCNMEAHVPVKFVTEKKDKIEFKNYYEEGLMTWSISEIEMAQKAHEFFITLKGLIVDLPFSLQNRQESRIFFFRRKCKHAFKVMEMELNFLYDVLYTKMAVVHSKIGSFFRFLCTALIAVSLERFASHHKRQLHQIDIAVTYTLLIGALALDLIALIKLIFSYWTIVLLKNGKATNFVYAIRDRLSFDKRWRWSNSVSQHSLIKYCLEERLNRFDKAARFLGIEDFLVEMKYIRTKLVDESLKSFIFSELRHKALDAKDPKIAKEMCSARGDWILSRYLSSVSPILGSVSQKVEYDESLLLWHIATDLCYFTCSENGDSTISDHREICKTLSDYMLYLVVMQPTIMSAVAGTLQIRFWDTCEETKKFFRTKDSNSKNSATIVLKNLWKKFFNGRQSKDSMEKRKLEAACSSLLAVDVVVKPIELKGEKSKSLLFDACILAKDLMKLKKKMWEIMSKVWVELLCYAAIHCKANAYAQHLSKGGELITFVWLLMSHFGLREQFRKDDIPIFKLIVSK